MVQFEFRMRAFRAPARIGTHGSLAALGNDKTKLHHYLIPPLVHRAPSIQFFRGAATPAISHTVPQPSWQFRDVPPDSVVP